MSILNTILIGKLKKTKADKSNVLLLNNEEVYTPSSNYNPATKEYVDASISVLGLSDSVIKTYESSGTSQVISMSFSSTFRAAEYIITSSSSNGFGLIKLLVVHDDYNSVLSAYGEVGEISGSFDTQIDGTNVDILFTPSIDGVVLKYFETLIVK